MEVALWGHLALSSCIVVDRIEVVSAKRQQEFPIVVPMCENTTASPANLKCLRVLVVGGCHIDHRAIGLPKSFVDVMIERIRIHGVATQLESVLDAKASHRHRILRKCQTFGPDLIVMQLGHAETLRSQLGRSKALLGLDTGILKPVALALSWKSKARGTFAGSVGWIVKQCLKTALDFGTGQRNTDVSAFLAARARLALGMAKIHPKNPLPFVIWMSPFPCADWVVRRYRGEISSRLLAEPFAENELFFDVFGLAERAEWRRRRPYLDAIHIDETAHVDIGLELGETCVRLLAQCALHIGNHGEDGN